MEEKRYCSSCYQYDSGYCKQWKQQIPDLSAAISCKKYSITKPLNRGLEIRQNKLNKKARKRAMVKPEQVDLVCFVDFSVKVIERVNGKYRHPTRVEYGKGLQIKNKIYLPNGRYKMVNRTTLKITKRYMDTPEWANEYLIDLYNKANQTIL